MGTVPSRRFGLRTKFILLILAILATVFTLVAAFMLRDTVTTMRRDLIERSKAFATLATNPIGATFSIYKDSGTYQIDQQVARFTSLDPSITNVAIVDLRGNVVYSQNKGVQGVTVAEANTFDPIYTQVSGGIPHRIIYPLLEDSGRHSYAVIYDVSSAVIDAQVRSQVINIIIFALLGLVLSAILTFLFVDRLFIRPLAFVSRSAGLIAAGELNQSIPVHGRDEIGDLARSVAHMAETLQADIHKLEEVDRLKNEFIMITSHNLRTPLTIIKGNVELLQSTKLSADTKNMIHSIETSALTLSIFSEDMLTIASIEAGNTALIKRDEQIASAIGAVEQEVENQAAMNKVTVKWKVNHPERMINVSARHLRDVIRNLMNNAIKFSPEGGTVNFTLDRTDSQLVITVADKGTGIKSEEMPKLFTKFHRGTSTLQYDYQGTGIGLYASKLIVDAHGGTIGVESVEGKGSTFTVRIPQPLIASAR